MGDENKEFNLDDYLGNIKISDITDHITLSGSDVNYQDWLQDYTGAIDLGSINIDSGPYYTDPLTRDNISLTSGGEEMLRIAEDGFYVRGVKVKQSKREARAVYNAFRRWMTSAIMSGDLE